MSRSNLGERWEGREFKAQKARSAKGKGLANREEEKEGLYGWSRGSKGKGDVGWGRGRRWRPELRRRRSFLFMEEEWMGSYR